MLQNEIAPTIPATGNAALQSQATRLAPPAPVILPAYRGPVVQAQATPIIRFGYSAPLVQKTAVTSHGVPRTPTIPVANPVPIYPASHVVHSAPIVHASAYRAPVVQTIPVVHHAPVVHAAPVVQAVHATPVVHAAPVIHQAPVAHSAPAYHAPDGNGNAEGSYSVALPDGRIQHVNYKADGYEGYVADVTYEGTAVYPEAPVVKAVAPVAAYAG